MYFSLNCYKGLLGLEDTFSLKKDETLERISDYQEYCNDDMLFPNYESASYWLKEHSKVNVNGMDISTKENEIYELNFSSYEFEIITHRIKKPRLFNKQEIYEVLNEGNDSYNNVLVIDYDGNPHLFNWDEYCQDDIERYPVRLEVFCAGNGYVGVNVKSSEIDDIYRCCLEGWEMHLSSGRAVRQDYVSKKEGVLLAEINRIMERYDKE